MKIGYFLNASTVKMNKYLFICNLDTGDKFYYFDYIIPKLFFIDKK